MRIILSYLIPLYQLNQNENEQAVDALYCDAYIDGNPIYLIVDTGSTGSLISKKFLDWLGRKIDTPSTINMVDVNGGKKRSLGKVKDLPINIKGTIIPIDVDVSESPNFSILVGNDWLTKTKGTIDYNHRVMELHYNDRRIRCGVTCWKKPEWDENEKPIGVEPKEKEKEKEPEIELEEYEDEQPMEEQSYCALMGNTLEQPLVQVDQQTITIGNRKEPISYYQELEILQQPIISTKPVTRDWKGPNSICWCDHVLGNENDVCKTCQQKSQGLGIITTFESGT